MRCELCLHCGSHFLYSWREQTLNSFVWTPVHSVAVQRQDCNECRIIISNEHHRPEISVLELRDKPLSC